MSYPPNIERRDTSETKLMEDMVADAEERALLEHFKQQKLNQIRNAIRGLVVDTDVVVQVLATLSCEAHKSGLLHGADLDALDEAASFIGGTP